LLSLLDERMQHCDSLANDEAVKRATYAGPPMQPQLEQAIAERTRVRQAQSRAVFE